MFKLKAPDGTNNLCGKNLILLRESHNPPLSQRGLARLLQISGYDVDNHFIRRVENGERFVTDIEIKMLAEVLNVGIDALFESQKEAPGNQ